MANHTRAWDETTPLDTEKAGFGARRMREGEADLRERLAVNHNMNVSQTETDTDFDGRHTIVDLTEQVAAPARGISNLGSVYSKNDGTYTELFYENENGDEYQITGSSNSCSVYMSVDTVVAANSRVDWDAEDYDYGSNFASSAYTCPVDGIYLLSLHIPGGSVGTALNLYINSVNITKIGTIGYALSYVNYFSSGDVLEIYRISGSSGTVYGKSGHSNNYSYWSITMLHHII